MKKTLFPSALRLAALAVFAGTSALAALPSTLSLRQNAKLGSILTAQNGKTLYLFTKDTQGESNCYDQCAVAWPPLYASSVPTLPDGVPGEVSLVTRKDGRQQVAYNGMPLYYWVKDLRPGETSGQNVGKVWFAVNPAPVVDTSSTGELGDFLVAPNGMTLYLYTKDTSPVSTCYDQCAVAWPPLLSAHIPESANAGGKLATTTRKDGAFQVTYDGKPLYYWFKDVKPGDTTGQNVGKVWFVVKP